MEMTPLQGWFLIYGDQVPSVEDARDLIDIEAGIRFELLKAELALEMISKCDPEKVAVLVDKLITFTEDLLQAISEEQREFPDAEFGTKISQSISMTVVTCILQALQEAS